MITLTKKYTLREYFEQEIQSQTRHEYLDGKIMAMTGGTPTHNRIIANLLVALYTKLKNQSYAVFVTDQRLWIPERQMATYPDIMVTSEPLSYQEGRKDTLVNPVLITEVLSASTANYDREGKFAAYRTIPSFQEYLLISQERCYIEQFHKKDDNWFFKAFETPTIITLKSLQVEVEIADIYNKINFANNN
ncbi:MAG: Uma2 family endonuclease [Woronichinia naegeliana WA131]|jgi:Uma2 family endonuclease|uniref:Uma2 family endonuclease n=1 Tax=Woronichinia naegeliana WA131 TaxID=2824559 RepID=A0A977PXL2_9CYAN|nr:MAG: Uma2 family endonuclease [Woronichinia naegeliana WA131]